MAYETAYPGRLYFPDLIQVHRALGLTYQLGSATLMAYITPKKESEVIIIADSASSDFYQLIFHVLRAFIDDMGLFAWSMSHFLPSLDGRNSLPALARIVDRGESMATLSDSLCPRMRRVCECMSTRAGGGLYATLPFLRRFPAVFAPWRTHCAQPRHAGMWMSWALFSHFIFTIANNFTHTYTQHIRAQNTTHITHMHIPTRLSIHTRTHAIMLLDITVSLRIAGLPTSCRSDISAMELFAESNVNADPFRVIEAVRKSLDKQLTSSV